MNGFAPAASRADPLGRGHCWLPWPCPGWEPAAQGMGYLDQGLSVLKDWADIHQRKAGWGQTPIKMRARKKGAQWKHAPNKTSSRTCTETLFIITKRQEIIAQTNIINRRMGKMGVAEWHNEEETTATHSMGQPYSNNMLPKRSPNRKRIYYMTPLVWSLRTGKRHLHDRCRNRSYLSERETKYRTRQG